MSFSTSEIMDHEYHRESEVYLIRSVVKNYIESFLDYFKRCNNWGTNTPKLRTVWEIALATENTEALKILVNHINLVLRGALLTEIIHEIIRHEQTNLLGEVFMKGTISFRDISKNDENALQVAVQTNNVTLVHALIDLDLELVNRRNTRLETVLFTAVQLQKFELVHGKKID